MVYGSELFQNGSTRIRILYYIYYQRSVLTYSSSFYSNLIHLLSRPSPLDGLVPGSAEYWERAATLPVVREFFPPPPARPAPSPERRRRHPRASPRPDNLRGGRSFAPPSIVWYHSRRARAEAVMINLVWPNIARYRHGRLIVGTPEQLGVELTGDMVSPEAEFRRRVRRYARTTRVPGRRPRRYRRSRRRGPPRPRRYPTPRTSSGAPPPGSRPFPVSFEPNAPPRFRLRSASREDVWSEAVTAYTRSLANHPALQRFPRRSVI